MRAVSTAQSKPSEGKPTATLSPLAGLVLLRSVPAPGVTRAELGRDIRPLAFQAPTEAVWRPTAEQAIADLLAADLVTDSRNRVKATAAGLEQVAALFGGAADPKSGWPQLREGHLTAQALGLSADKATLKALVSADHLRAFIVQNAYGLSSSRPVSHAKLRASLAVRALERAFGNQIKSGLGTGGGLGPKPSRLLAGQLLKVPRDAGSDSRLIAALAAEHLGTANADADTLRSAVLRRHYLARMDAWDAPPRKPPAAAHAAPELPDAAHVPSVANDRGEAGQRPLPAARPDLAGFIVEVQRAAHRRAEGWPGNRKAFISHVWAEVRTAHPAWALTEIEFKAMLAEAHRAGGLVLANADLKDKKNIHDFESSAIQYKNTVWHFVRVEEP